MMIKGTKFFVTFICVMSTGGQPSADPIDITQIKVTKNFVPFTIHKGNKSSKLLLTFQDLCLYENKGYNHNISYIICNHLFS